MEKYFERRKILFLFGFLCTSIDRMTRRACYTKRLMDLREWERSYLLRRGPTTTKLQICLFMIRNFKNPVQLSKVNTKNHLFLTQRILRHHCFTHLDTLEFDKRNISLRWRSKNFIILIDHFTFFPGNCWIDFGDFYENLK